MFILFKRSHTYVVDRPLEQVESKLRWIVTRRWDDHSVDIVGKLTSEGKFKLTSKWALVPVKWVENRPGYIDGRLEAEAERTNIQITTKPNRLLVSLFYLVLVFLTLELANVIDLFNIEKKYKLVFLAGFGGFLLLVIILFKNGVRKRFEQLMHLK